MFAPVALFVYKRLWHTQETISALASNTLADQTELIIFSDGPKSEPDTEVVGNVRSYIRTITGFKSIEIIERPENMGLANSIIDGVTNILTRYDKVIVLEDDLVTSPSFLTYMNNALELYKSDEEVISVHGYVYPVPETLPETFFLRGADCWGWATWKHGWRHFERDGKRLLRELIERNLEQAFDLDGGYPYTRMLKKQIEGKNDSWAIRWHASAFIENKLTLYPGKSLVQNIGNDSSGTHSWDNTRYNQKKLAQSIKLERLILKEDTLAKRLISKYLKSTSPSMIRKIFSRLKFLLNKK